MFPIGYKLSQRIIKYNNPGKAPAVTIDFMMDYSSGAVRVFGSKTASVFQSQQHLI